jgi:hypothetical protein
MGLDIVEVVMRCEETFDVRLEPIRLEQMRTVGDLFELVWGRTLYRLRSLVFGKWPGGHQGKLLKTPFSRRFRPVLVATMPAVHAPKLKPTIAPRRMRALSF